jgi:hypothetical protein
MRTTSWRKSSRSTNSGDQNCVEVRKSGPQFQFRDSKLGGDSPIFVLAAEEYTGLLGAARK